MNVGYIITQGFPTWGAFAYLKGYIQARSYGGAGGLLPSWKIFRTSWKNVLDIV